MENVIGMQVFKSQ